jgi:hypothetical protein
VLSELSKNPEKVKTLNPNELNMLKDSFGKGIYSINDLHDQISLIILVLQLEVPLVRKGVF